MPFYQKLWLLLAQVVTVTTGIFWAYQAVDSLHHNIQEPQTRSQQAPEQPARPSVAPQNLEGFRQAAQIALPAVVSIDPSPAHNLGSGVIVTTSGYILTNQHVVNKADRIEVLLNDQRKLRAKLIGSDLDSDLAVLKIDVDKPLPAIELAPTPQVGDIALAIGNPYGVGQTVTFGIVSGLGRHQLGISTYENFIQTDAAINPGNSGGALVDTQGRLLGINTAIFTPRSGGSLGISFAIPSEIAKFVLDSLIADGDVRRGYIGIEPQTMTPEMAETFGIASQSGVLIAGLLHNGPAANAGLRVGDVVIAIEKQTISNPHELLNTIAKFKPGSQREITALRNNQTFTTTVEIGLRPKPQKAKAHPQ